MHREAFRAVAFPITLGTFVALLLVMSEPAADASEPGRRMSTRERARVELGRRLFFDPAVSRLGFRSCADCHAPDHGFSDPSPRSFDERGPTRRHSQTLIDGADNPSAHWDGEFAGVRDLVTARLVRSVGRGVGSRGQAGRLSVGSSSMPAPREAPSGGGSYGGGSAPSSARPSPAQPGPTGAGNGGSQDDAGGDDESYAPEDDSGATPSAREMRAPSESSPAAPAPEASPDAAAPDPEPTAPMPAPGEAPPPDAPDDEPSPEDERRPDESYAGTDHEAENALGHFVDPDADVSRWPTVIQRLEREGRYHEAFRAAFGSRSITLTRVAKAIEAFCHTIRSGEAPFDRYRAGDETALSTSARRGLELFAGKAGCASCHSMEGDRPAFTDYRFHNTGAAWLRALQPNASVPDLGLAGITTRRSDARSFKTPTLRDVARRGPFMHDGSVPTLRDAVLHYARGARPPGDAGADPDLDPRIRPFLVNAQELDDLVAFLESLTSDRRPGHADVLWDARSDRIALRLVDDRGRPLAGWELELVPAGDTLPGTSTATPVAVRTDDEGRAVAAVPATTHLQVVLPHGLRPVGGGLLPDTARDVEIVVPVDGFLDVEVKLDSMSAPETLTLEHVAAETFPDRRWPRTLLPLLEVQESPGGGVTARYRAPRRTDVPAAARLALPIPRWGLDHLHLFPRAGDTIRVDLSAR